MMRIAAVSLVSVAVFSLGMSTSWAQRVRIARPIVRPAGAPAPLLGRAAVSGVRAMALPLPDRAPDILAGSLAEGFQRVKAAKGITAAEYAQMVDRLRDYGVITPMERDRLAGLARRMEKKRDVLSLGQLLILAAHDTHTKIMLEEIVNGMQRKYVLFFDDAEKFQVSLDAKYALRTLDRALGEGLPKEARAEMALQLKGLRIKPYRLP